MKIHMDARREKTILNPWRQTGSATIGILQRKCACGVHSVAGGVCGVCDRKRGMLQRQASVTSDVEEVPPIVHETLSAPGHPLDGTTRAFMESRLGRDFSGVRVHTGARAAESARAVNALAYTVGRNVVFGEGQYAPETSGGRRLIAHELTHVAQQTRNGSSQESPHALTVDDSGELEADSVATQTLLGSPARIAALTPSGALQRQEKKNPLDDKAKAIIAKAKDTKVDADKRAAQLVKDIISEYYSGDAVKVDSVIFDDAKAGTGLNTESVGSGATTKGKISVGNYFLNNVDSFARRVLQVGHELQHIDQYRGGLAGGQNKDKREFLAFYDEASATEKSGTGRLSYATRLALIDAALGYFYCLSDDDQKAFDSKKQALLKRRDEVNGKGGNEPTDPPAKCKRQ
jgi:hypothetical protein